MKNQNSSASPSRTNADKPPLLAWPYAKMGQTSYLPLKQPNIQAPRHEVQRRDRPSGDNIFIAPVPAAESVASEPAVLAYPQAV